MSKFLIPLYTDGEFTGHVTVDAEGCCGLYVHRAPDDMSQASPWRLVNVVGFRVVSGPLRTRQDAREMARHVSKLLPPEIMRGEWKGSDWFANDPVAAGRYKRLYF